MNNIVIFTERMIALAVYRKQLYSYLEEKMSTVAPNLSALIGETVAARYSKPFYQVNINFWAKLFPFSICDTLLGLSKRLVHSPRLQNAQRLQSKFLVPKRLSFAPWKRKGTPQSTASFTTPLSLGGPLLRTKVVFQDTLQTSAPSRRVLILSSKSRQVRTVSSYAIKLKNAFVSMTLEKRRARIST